MCRHNALGRIYKSAPTACGILFQQPHNALGRIYKSAPTTQSAALFCLYGSWNTFSIALSGAVEVVQGWYFFGSPTTLVSIYAHGNVRCFSYPILISQSIVEHFDFENISKNSSDILLDGRHAGCRCSVGFSL